MSMFNELLVRAKEQPSPQQILFLFTATDVTRKSRKQDTQRGTISPVMMVDKTPDELSNFAHLMQEADGINANWDMVFIACLSGNGAASPTPEDIEYFLKQMAKDVEGGTNIHRYVVFDRKENPIEISAG
ncbi:MAG: ribonucleotide reductase subunit alpha [Aestuariibacter sp.]